MCGIVGYVGERAAAPLVLQGLRQLEYRGYDSAGMAVVGADGKIHVRRAAGKLSNLAEVLDKLPVHGAVGVGHTRWATHGPPVERNAHPHSSPDGAFVVVQNGIVENFVELRERLRREGYTFKSDTDTEVIVHLIHQYYHNGCHGDLPAAVRRALAQLQGPSAIVVLCQDCPEYLVAARLGNAGGVAVGLGDGETFVASDVPAILAHTRRMVFLDNGQVAVVTRHGADYMALDGAPVRKQVTMIDWSQTAAEKGEYRHFMQKEIFEQGRSLTDTLRGRLDFERNQVVLDSLKLTQEQALALEKVTIVACGTSYYAGLIGKYYLERLVRLPVEVDYASEFRYRQPVVRPNHMVLAITQSGETVDTLAALEEGRENGAFTAAIVNAVGSQAARVCDGVIYMQAGPEIGVASTKAFTASVTDLLMLAIHLGQLRGVLGEAERAPLIHALSMLPGLAGQLLEDAWRGDHYRRLAEEFHTFHNFLYLGRGMHYPVAREGALKLKEISYIHAEGYPAGEMKHGPIALIDPSMPTVALAPRDGVYEKMISQVEQVKARHGTVLAVAHPDDSYIRTKVDHVLPVPASHELLQPILSVIPLQVFAYEMAVRRGADVDQPRNLAKSVTVE
ncbi:MAG TPA: glutamine--fructose-6-phosphate transaminase (isomerizing) [Caldilineaceae bacterium]|nr:glutamine--fructose-6-phosphate transaminase (isomerizing) [Caldilineaceae bacterium]